MSDIKIPRLLRADEIETRVSQYIEGKGLSLLLYKTARVDMDILDETYGAGAWENDYKEIKGNLYCGICVNGVWKWDCGKESFADAEKGEASDAFKRAGFRWGIGRELYSAPFIWIQEAKFETRQVKGKTVPKDRFSVKKIMYDDNRKINGLTIVNDRTGIPVYTMCAAGQQEPKKTAKEGQGEQIPAKESEPAKTAICADCGKAIESDVIARGTLKLYGRMLCRNCGMAEKKKRAT